jgi:hypothetical protein
MNQECIYHTGATVDGYGVLKRLGKNVRAHRWSYCTHHNLQLKDISGMVVMHNCDNRLCINPAHLSLGTHADNCADKVKKGRQAKGEISGNSKLKNYQVIEIKSRMLRGHSNTQLAEKFGVCTMTISRIRSGKTWRSV